MLYDVLVEWSLHVHHLKSLFSCFVTAGSGRLHFSFFFLLQHGVMLVKWSKLVDGGQTVLPISILLVKYVHVCRSKFLTVPSPD